MTQVNYNRTVRFESTEASNKSIYRLGGAALFIALIGTLLDMMISLLPGWSVSAVSETALARFAQFQENWLIGLYHLDFLNMILSLIMIPVFCAIYTAHRDAQREYGLLALIIFIIGTAIFVANNAALPMLDLSMKYSLAATEIQRAALAAAGEAVLAKGGHGSAGAFMGFLLSTLASLVMAYTMLKGKVFSKAAACIGLIGFTMLLFYTIIIAFVSKSNNIIMLLAMPGGILAIAWNIIVAKKLWSIGRK